MQIRLIDQDGSQLGLVEMSEAQKIAAERDLDLIVVAKTTNPQVYRLMDYGKEQYKKHKKEKKKARKTKTKGIRLSLRTGEHDLELKAKNANRFLKQGHKVKLEIFLRGREKAFRKDARKNLEEFLNKIKESYKTEQSIKGSPRGFNTIICQN